MPAGRVAEVEPGGGGIILAGVGPADDEGMLVAAARSGDSAAFEELVERYERRIFRVVQAITQNREDAEDALQESFLNAFNHVDGFHGESRFSTWLTRIAVNQALMKLRKRRPDHFSLDELIETEGDSMPREIVDWGPTPEQRYSQQELREILAGAMGQINPINRVVFQLRDVEEFSIAETAQALGLSNAAVKSRLMRARLELREKLNPYFRRNRAGGLKN